MKGIDERIREEYRKREYKRRLDPYLYNLIRNQIIERGKPE